MARLRTLKPGFFKNELLAEIPPLGRLLFQGLWTIADRRGRLEDRPKRIKAEVLPYDDADIETLLDELSRRGFIVRYEVGGENYIQINNFEKHQQPHKNEADSTIPEPDKHGASTVSAPEEHVTSSPVFRLPSSVNGLRSLEISRVATQPAAKAAQPGQTKSASQMFDFAQPAVGSANSETGGKATLVGSENSETQKGQVPATLDGWISKLKSPEGEKNPVALVAFAAFMLAGGDPEDRETYKSTCPRIGKLCNRAGKDYGYVLKLLWEASAARPAGDLVNYVEGRLRNKNSRAGSFHERRIEAEKNLHRRKIEEI